MFICLSREWHKSKLTWLDHTLGDSCILLIADLSQKCPIYWLSTLIKPNDAEVSDLTLIKIVIQVEVSEKKPNESAESRRRDGKVVLTVLHDKYKPSIFLS